MRAFALYWTLNDDKGLKAAKVSAMDLAKEAEGLTGHFPNAAVNADERRKLRVALYRPLLSLEKDECSRVVDLVLAILLGERRMAARKDRRQILCRQVEHWSRRLNVAPRIVRIQRMS